MKYFLNIVFVLLLFISYSNAAEYRTGESVYVDEGDTLKSDLFAGARNVEIQGIILGDVYSGCKELQITGEIEDDLIAGCQNLRIHNKVGDLVIGFAEQIIIDSEIGGDVLAWGGHVRITKKAHIKGDLYVGTGDLLFEGGRIDGEIKGGAGQAHLNGHVLGHVELGLHEANVEFGEDYRAEKGTTLKLHKPLPDDIANLPENLEIIYEEHEYFFQTMFFFWSVVAMIIVGILMVTIFKNFFRDVISYGKKYLLKNTGAGFLMLVATPIVAVILGVLIITIPLSLILFAVYFILLYLSSIITGLFIGNYIMEMLKKDEKSTNLILSLVIGVIAVALVSKIPFIGWLLCLLIICFGLGTFILYIFQISKTKNQTT